MLTQKCSQRKAQNPTESYTEQVSRITILELLRSHHAQPLLVESLLLARDVKRKITGASRAVSMDIILGLTKFEQKTNWLFPWGAELVDPARRQPGSLPRDTPKPVDWHLTLLGAALYNDLSKEDITALLRDSKQQ